jgi:hypothetical protein
MTMKQAGLCLGQGLRSLCPDHASQFRIALDLHCRGAVAAISTDEIAGWRPSDIFSTHSTILIESPKQSHIGIDHHPD